MKKICAIRRNFYTYWIFYIQIQFEKTMRKQRFRSFRFQIETSKTSKIDQTMISIKTCQNIFVRKSHDDFNKKFFRRFKNDTNAKSFDRNTILNRKMTWLRYRINAKQFKIKKIIKNSRSIKLTEIQSKYIVSSTFRSHELSMQQTKSYSNFMKFILFHKKNVDFAKIDHEKNNNWTNRSFLNEFTSHDTDFNNQTFSNNNIEFFATKIVDINIKHCRKKISHD